MPWFKVTSDTRHTGLHAQIQNEFDTLFVKAKSPIDAALYSKRISEDEIELYFSPNASRFAIGLIAKYGGFRCEEPSGNVLLVVGHPDRNLMKPQMRSFCIEAEYWYCNQLYERLSDPVTSASIIKYLFQSFPKKVA